MIAQQSNKTKVYVLSAQKGCLISQNLLKNYGYQFVFLKQNHPSNTSINDFFIIDHLNAKNSVIGSNAQLIILNDSEKSHGSILALSGVLSTFGQYQKQQFVSSHIVDFVVGISLAILLLQRSQGNKSKRNTNMAQISLVQLVKYFGAFNISSKQNGLLGKPLGKNYLDGGAPFYGLYKCKQGILAVGNLEPKFYIQMIKAMKFDAQKQIFLLQNQINQQAWPKIKSIFVSEFSKKTAYQWQKIMSTYDTCVTQVIQKKKQKAFQFSKTYPLAKL